MKRYLFSMVVSAAVFAAAAGPLWANVYASGLEQTGPNSFSYVLNEDASNGVTVEVWKVGGGLVHSETLGAQTKGAQSWTWDGTGYTAGDTYTVKVNASSAGYASWTKTTANTTENNFYSPRGVDVNKNANSPYFGRIYVGESVGGTCSAGRVVQDGIYILKADVTDAVGQGDTSRTGGVTWGTTNSPFRVSVGPDDRVYVTDWSDLHSGLWVGDADFNSATEVLDSTGRDATGLNATHGSISAVHVEGVGAARTIYTIDEDYPLASSGQRGSIWRYDIGDNATFSGAPSAALYDDAAAGNLILNYYNDFVRASDGTWWVSQDRSGSTTDTLSSLMQISADGTTVLWKSIPSLAANSATDPVRRTRGLAWDPVNDYLALATYNAGKVLIFDDDTKAIIATIEMGTTATNRDIAFDAAGNLYVVDNATERLQIWSPGTGANSFMTETWFTIVPEPAAIALLGLGGLVCLRRRQVA